MQITKTTVPETISTRENVNPFTGMFPTDDGVALTLVLPSDTDDRKKTVKTVVNQAQEAGRVVPASERFPKGTTTRKRLDSVYVVQDGDNWTELAPIPEDAPAADKKTYAAAQKLAVQGTRLTFWSVDKIERPRKDADAPADAPADSE